jgi:chemotaxis protein CheZ
MAMPVQRKFFRIEQRTSAEAEVATSARDAEAAMRHREFMQEIRTLRSLIQPGAAAPGNRDAMEKSRAQIAEVQSYKTELELIHAAIQCTRAEIGTVGAVTSGPADLARASRELQAIVMGTDHATQKVLQAAEDIDQSANTLVATLKGSYEQGVANDIRERVVQIYEACNFQDLTGQRVGKVVQILGVLEDHVARLLQIWSEVDQFKPVVFEEVVAGSEFLNGPKLAGASGHSSQDDIDVMFD